jgi:hypothetical protein
MRTAKADSHNAHFITVIVSIIIIVIIVVLGNGTRGLTRVRQELHPLEPYPRPNTHFQPPPALRLPF